MILKKLFEAYYENNLGFQEMLKFYEVATEEQIDKLENLIDSEKSEQAWDYVQQVTGMKLHGLGTN